MAYKLELSSGEQKTLLSSTVQKWSNCQPDMYIISMEGHKIYTQRILLGLHSALIDSLLSSTAGMGGGGADLPGISVPASSGSLVNLLKILSTGIAIATNKSHLLETTKAAEAIGIKLDNCQIGIKKKKPEVVKQVSPNIRKRKSPGVETPTKKTKLEDDVKKEVNDQEDEIPTPEMSSNSGPQKKHHCSQCDKKFSSKQALQRHVILHSENPTPFGCDKCEKKFDRKYRLEKHKKTAHGDVPEVECDTNEVDTSVTDDQPHHPEEKQEAEGDVFNEGADSGNVELDENFVQGDEGMKLDDLEAPVEDLPIEAPDVSDPEVKEKLLADRQKLLAELNSLEGQGDLDFLNTE